ESLGHPLVILAAALPWSIFALVTLRPGFAKLWDERGRNLLAACHCWTSPNLLFWSVLPEHAPRHSFPLLPRIARLATLAWGAFLTARLKWRVPCIKPGGFLIASVIVWLAAKLAFVHVVIPHRNQNREPRAKGELLAEMVPGGQTLYLFNVKDEGIMFY